MLAVDNVEKLKRIQRCRQTTDGADRGGCGVLGSVAMQLDWHEESTNTYQSLTVKTEIKNQSINR